MMKRIVFGAMLASGLIALSSACGTTESEFPEPDGSNGGNGSTSGFGIDPGGDGGDEDGGRRVPPDLEECAVDSLGGDLLPVEMTMLFDKSSSMCYYYVTQANSGFDCNHPTVRWPATVEALKTFMGSVESTGLAVAVRTFGPVVGPGDNKCEARHYETPDFPVTDLPSATLADQITATLPEFGGAAQNPNLTQTQTAGVIAGAARYTKQRQDALAGVKNVVMLLVSDGKPEGCAANGDQDKADAIAAAQAAFGQGLRVYVLSIGGDADTLNQIAAAGGTGAAINIVDTTNAQEIAEAFAEIRGRTLSCEFDIPTPASGTPDYEKLNVAWTPGPNAEAATIPQSADCSNPNGWQYDDPSDPKKIRLCESRCREVLGSSTGKIDIVLGCQTNTGPVN